MTYANQTEYDNAAEPELDDYHESPEYTEFCDHLLASW